MTLLRQYTIVQKCGSGALSDVFCALDSNGDKVAIKSLKVFFKEESVIKERLTKEALILKELRDEKIVKYKDFFFDDQGTPSLVVEYVEGKDLSYYIKNIGSKSIPFIGAQLVSEILLGLEEVHRFGFIHRDLKPENIMLTHDGKIKITDFGLARNLESHDLTLSGTILGSPIFMSPEQCRGDQVDERSDIFSLGVLLYYFATMGYPFKGESYPMIAKAITQKEPTAPMQSNPYVDEKLNKIILKALAKNPGERYQKVYEMRNDLMFFLDEFKVSHHTKVFREFVDNVLSEERGYEQKIVEKYKSLFYECKANNKPKSQFYLNQLIKIDPGLATSLTLVPSEEGSLLRMKWLATSLAILFFLICWKWYIPFQRVTERSDALAISPQKKKVLPPTVRKTSLVTSYPVVLAPVKILPKKIVPIALSPQTKISEAITGIKFSLPEDTKVYVDNVEVDIKEIYKVNPGKHRLKMIRSRFTPIESEIDVLANKVTTINVEG